MYPSKQQAFANTKTQDREVNVKKLFQPEVVCRCRAAELTLEGNSQPGSRTAAGP